MPVKPSSTLTLVIQGLVPGKKNSKMVVTRDRRGRPLKHPMLITNPEFQRRLATITEDLRLQLLAAFRTAKDGTSTEYSLPFWIAQSMPLDDAWTYIPQMTVRVADEMCRPGEEGVVVTIERID